VLGHDSQALSGVDSPLTQTPAGVSALNDSTLERDGSPLEGAIDPRARWVCTEAAPYPSSGAEFCPRVAGPIV
jgi:hypothetical protein